MAYDEKAAERVRRALAGNPDLAERKMMGGICFMVKGNMVCGVTGASLMVRVGRDAQPEMLALPNVRPMKLGDRRPAGFVLVDPAGYRTAASLARWIERGIAYAATLPPKAPAGKRARRRG